MEQRQRKYCSAEQRAEVSNRPQPGKPMTAIGQLFDRGQARGVPKKEPQDHLRSKRAVRLLGCGDQLSPQ